MLTQPTADKLRDMRLHGMLAALNEQSEQPEYKKLSFEERFGFLVDREWSDRQGKRLASRIRKANFREKALMEDLDFDPKRAIDRRQVLYLGQPEWIHNYLNTILVGATGSGKTYLACALGDAACKNNFTVRYYQTAKLLRQMSAARADGTYDKLVAQLSKTRLLILDDWLLTNLSLVQTRDMLEIVDDKYDKGSIIFATQLPVSEWHSRFDDPTLADAIMDRVVHNAYRIDLEGDSKRKHKKTLTQSGQ